MPSAKPTPTRAGQSSSNASSPNDDASPELIFWGSKVDCGTKKFRFLRKRTISATTSAVVDIGDDSARRDRGARPATPSL